MSNLPYLAFIYVYHQKLSTFLRVRIFVGDELSLQSSVYILYPDCMLHPVYSLHFVLTEFPTRSEKIRKILVLFVGLRAFGCFLRTISDKTKWNDNPPSPQSNDEGAKKQKRAILASLKWGEGWSRCFIYFVQDCRF